MFNAQTVEILSKHIQIAHHIKGRVRFKIDLKIQNYADIVDLDALSTLDKKISGIKSVSLNRIAKSLTVEYNPDIVSKVLWEELANSDDYEDISMRLNNLIKED